MYNVPIFNRVKEKKMLLDIIIMHKKREGIIVKDLRGLEEILSDNESIKYKIIESNNEKLLIFCDCNTVPFFEYCTILFSS